MAPASLMQVPIRRNLQDAQLPFSSRPCVPLHHPATEPTLCLSLSLRLVQDTKRDNGDCEPCQLVPEPPRAAEGVTHVLPLPPPLDIQLYQRRGHGTCLPRQPVVWENKTRERSLKAGRRWGSRGGRDLAASHWGPAPVAPHARSLPTPATCVSWLQTQLHRGPIALEMQHFAGSRARLGGNEERAVPANSEKTEGETRAMAALLGKLTCQITRLCSLALQSSPFARCLITL